jgi:hypothetical protein
VGGGRTAPPQRLKLLGALSRSGDEPASGACRRPAASSGSRSQCSWTITDTRIYLAVRKRLAAREGAFSLRRWELPVAIGALAWLVVALLVLVLPHEARVPVLIVVGLLLAGGVFFLLMLTFDRKSLEAEPGDVSVLDG